MKNVLDVPIKYRLYYACLGFVLALDLMLLSAVLKSF